MRFLEEHIDEIVRKGYYPRTEVIESAINPRVEINGRKYLLFSSNNYLGFSTNARLKKASVKAIKKYGTGSGASRIVAGTLKIHDDLEKEIAKFKCTEAAMVLSSGYSTNVSLISALTHGLTAKTESKIPETVLFSDSLNHASLVDGIKLSGSKCLVYPHVDMHALEDLLKRYVEYRKIIITDTVFSMDGDIAPLEQIVRLSKKYNSLILVDEAHATGVLGKEGRGAVDMFGVTKDVQFIMGTLSKAVGSVGAYFCSSNKVVKLMKVAMRGFVFSTALPPGDAAASLEAIKLLQENPDLGHEILEKSDYLRNHLNEIGFSTLGSKTQIVPILIGDEVTSHRFQAELRNRMILASTITWPAVEWGKSRIRFSLMASHSQEDIDELVSACKDVKKEMKL